jgi:23S rRNA pseudouridine1911/1915/1917 synthase
MSSLGHPVYGDLLYGGEPCKRFVGQCLHAKIIEFTHPRSGERMRFETGLPGYFEETIERLRRTP